MLTTYVERLKRSMRSVHHAMAFRPTKDISIWALISARFQPEHVQSQRIEVLRIRVIALASLFSILALLWGIVDYFAFPRSIFLGLFIARWVLSICFIVITLVAIGRQRASALVGMIACFLALLTAFYFLCQPPYSGTSSLLGEIVLTSYSLMPFVLFAGLSFFPITLIESALLIVPLLVVFSVAASHTTSRHPYDLNFGSIWIMMVLGCISTLTSLSQLRLLIQQISLAAHDILTGCLGRLYGEQAIELTWQLGKRYNKNYAMAYFDLDHFKTVNDTFGHQQGDQVLLNTATRIKEGLRASDFLIRWGGEEFLIVLPDTDSTGVVKVIRRLYDRGFGVRPDGVPQTASIGFAERLLDNAGDWRDLIRIADERLYLAKTSGRNRYVGPHMPANLINIENGELRATPVSTS